MKSLLLSVSVVLLMASCTTAYKSGQTPDDVYYSPTRPQEEYVRVEREDDRRYRGEDYYAYEDDRYLRYKVRNRNRWSYLDDYYRDPYAFRNRSYYYYDPYYWNSRAYWNYYYNPYGTHVIITNPRNYVVNRPRVYNLHMFDNPNRNSYNPKMPGNASRQYNDPYRNTDRYRNTGSDLRNVFGTDRNTSNSKPATSAQSDDSNRRSSSSGSVENASKGSSSSGGSSKPIRKN